ncbi:N-acetylmuramoyl-L-alanine amidase family protein [Psychroflexus lacisalsi]|uniref:N-acetylmuramoyl-L-alanine amidase n=1 Tax=Psychroflexus lacisalsi TaxID=503928 RepID=A0ABN1K0B0_9FLAO|nr:N-acetylmuramoyl-L-alanine amidase [Psychroflexus lacisalsi]MBZ9620965.1 N-acetylmuramoyl-L-alanine amidase [Psychroflexus lacisalsi]
MRLLCFLFVFCVGFNFVSADPSHPNKIRVVIDAGHGGIDTGAQSNSILEKQIVADVSSHLKELCSDKNIEVILLRTEDEFMSLQDRLAKIEALSPDLVISLHANYSPDRDRNGVEVFVAENEFTVKSSYFGTKILESFKRKDFKTSDLKSANFFLLKNLKCPAVTVELGFLSNSEDMKYLNSEFGQKFLAKQIASSLD